MWTRDQAYSKSRDERSPKYDLAARSAKLDPKEFAITRQSGAILIDKFGQRYKEGLALIVAGQRFMAAVI